MIYFILLKQYNEVTDKINICLKVSKIRPLYQLEKFQGIWLILASGPWD